MSVIATVLAAGMAAYFYINLNQKIEQLQTSLGRVETERNELQQEKADIKQELTQAQQDIKKFQEDVTTKDDLIQKQEIKITDQTRMIQDRNNTIQGQERQLELSKQETQTVGDCLTKVVGALSILSSDPARALLVLGSAENTCNAAGTIIQARKN